MKRAVVLLALVVTACGERAGPTGQPQPDREAQIYAAVIRQLVTVDHTFGGGDPGFGTIFVLDRADPRANEGILPEDGRGTPIDAAVQEEIRGELGDLPPIRFVTDREQVVGPMESGGVVEDDGALVTLGTIPDGEERLEVGAGLYIANLAGTRLTYVVESTADGWQVTHTTGPVAIS